MKKLYHLLFLIVFAIQANAQCVSTAWNLPNTANSSTNTNISNYFNTNNVSIGAARMGVTITKYGNASLDVQRIYNGHQSQLGINIGHDDANDTNNYDNRIETQITLTTPVTNLKFTINDIDDQDVIKVRAYNENDILVNLAPSNVSLFSPTDITRTGNIFFGGSSDTSDTKGSVIINYNGLKISRLVFEYYDTDDGGTYTVAEFSGITSLITATNDNFSAVSGVASTTASVLNNDNVCGVTANTASVSLSSVGALPVGFTLNSNGTIAVANTVAVGNYAINYKICETNSTTNCKTALANVNVVACGSGSAVPALNPATNLNLNLLLSHNKVSLLIPCGSTTANLSVLTASNKPAPSSVTLTWHTGTPATTANKIANTTALMGTAKYYAAFYDSVNGCYSPTREVIVFAPICTIGNDYTSTPIPTTVGGTLPTIFANDSYNGITITSISGFPITFVHELWVPVNAVVNDNGTVTIPPGLAPGIYTYYYKLSDSDPDVGTLINDSQAVPFTFRIDSDADNDGISDSVDVDDDNDGILDITECTMTIDDFLTQYVAGNTKEILPSDFGLALNVKNQNVTKDLSAKFGYPINSGAVIISIENASVHSLNNVWWTKNGEQPSVWTVSGTMSAFVGMGNDLLYYSNDSKTIHIYDNANVTPVTTVFPNQTAISGQWNITDNQSQRTLHNLNTNNATIENANWRYVNMNFGRKTFGFSTTVASGHPNYAVVMYLECDTDHDGIPDRLDLDSDADGCSDALEASANISTIQLVTANGTISGGSTTVNQNLCATTACVSTSGANIGLPQFTTIPSGYSNATGQTLGSSQNSTVSACFCTKPAMGGTPNGFTKIGITTQEKQNAWPGNIPNGFIAMESKEKGFVVTRVQNSSSIADPKAGMVIYDIDASCAKLYNGTTWKCIQRSCND